MSKDFASVLAAMSKVSNQDINPETGTVTRRGGTIISKESVKKVVEAGPSGLEGLEDVLNEITGTETKTVEEPKTQHSEESVLPSQDAYLAMMNQKRSEPKKKQIAENTNPDIITVEALPNETEIMESYVNMIQSNLY